MLYSMKNLFSQLMKLKIISLVSEAVGLVNEAAVLVREAVVFMTLREALIIAKMDILYYTL